MKPTFVFVPGSSSNSFSWAPLQRELALLGQRSLAVDLPGHGFAGGYTTAYQSPQDATALATTPSALAGGTLAEAVSHVLDVVRRAREHGPVVLVGHSRGGLAVTAAGNAEPDLLDRVVYVAAWCPVDVSVDEYMRSPENSTSVLLTHLGNALVADPAEIGALRINWRTADPELLAALKTALLADGTDEEFLGVLSTMQPDEILDAGGDADRARVDTWGRIRRTYVRLTRDESLPLALQDRFIREADALTPDNPFDVRSLESSHVGFLVRPRAAAELLAGLAG
ncbi:alpha/beta hydrolase [Saccharothrix obliqua]|uniref:alpha/beta hydrolase n=1 Tax=Saccharothrix obliqua TaxID=2861747 RepID=UPI001C5D9E3D|nr:alpha/beta hydrolase [Saccharothrix obliqua]MBW4717109.1 alpha/beta fold hydrolase [Saccharothrix obliqua]